VTVVTVKIGSGHEPLRAWPIDNSRARAADLLSRTEGGNAMNELPRIGLPTWREEAISRLVNVYDDPETADGQPIIKLKRGAGDSVRLNALLDLLSELYPEAAGLVRSSKASPKNRLTAVLGRLNEISLEGREFVAINATSYDWRDVDDEDQEEDNMSWASKSNWSWGSSPARRRIASKRSSPSA
jgi:hypothetical protein